MQSFVKIHSLENHELDAIEASESLEFSPLGLSPSKTICLFAFPFKNDEKCFLLHL